MRLRVKDLLKIEVLKKVKVISGESGLENEIKGVTIIEAPDIAKFVDGGEVLLTSLYAFKNCTREECVSYIKQLFHRGVSALVLKTGRDVAFSGEIILLLVELSEEYKIPIIEIPLEVPYRDIMYPIMEHLFNDEVTKLKYFKETHDNFVALSLSLPLFGKGFEKIMDALEKLIGNPVALFDKSLSCLFTTNEKIDKFAIAEDASEHNHMQYSKYSYLIQKVDFEEADSKVYNQYIVPIHISFGRSMYLVITEIDRVIDSLDYIAIENAITALLLELVKQRTVTELEGKFRSDIIENILNGKIRSLPKLHQNANLLGLSPDASYCVLVFNICNTQTNDLDFNVQLEYNNILADSILANFHNAKIHNQANSIVVLQEIHSKPKPSDHIQDVKSKAEKIQKSISKQNTNLVISAGIGDIVTGLVNIPTSFKEASDALLLVDMVESGSNDSASQIIAFSDLGTFRLLCKFENPTLLREFVPESLKKLYAYQKPQKDDLISTLKIYLNNNQNVAKTAQDLFVHYKTVNYRIERIVAITGMNFKSADDVLSVQVGLIILKLIDNYNRYNS